MMSVDVVARGNVGGELIRIFLPFLVDDDGAVGEELEGAAGGGFIDDADLGDGSDGDEFGGVAEGGDDALFLGGEAGKEVAEDELEGIITRRAGGRWRCSSRCRPARRSR